MKLSTAKLSVVKLSASKVMRGKTVGGETARSKIVTRAVRLSVTKLLAVKFSVALRLTRPGQLAGPYPTLIQSKQSYLRHYLSYRNFLRVEAEKASAHSNIRR